MFCTYLGSLLISARLFSPGKVFIQVLKAVYVKILPLKTLDRSLLVVIGNPEPGQHTQQI